MNKIETGKPVKRFIKIMKALADPNRVKILKLLQQKTMCVCELQGALGISQSSVSKHLKILEEAGLVDFFKDGLWVNYFLTKDSPNPYAAVMLENLKQWLEDDVEITGLIKKVPLLDREILCGRPRNNS